LEDNKKIRDNFALYRLTELLDLPNHSQYMVIGNAVQPVINWFDVREIDSVYTMSGSEVVTSTGFWDAFVVPKGRMVKIKRLYLYSGDDANKFGGVGYIAVEGNFIKFSASAINGLAYTADPHLYIEFRSPLVLKGGSKMEVSISAKGGADKAIHCKMFGVDCEDY